MKKTLKERNQVFELIYNLQLCHACTWKHPPTHTHTHTLHSLPLTNATDPSQTFLPNSTHLYRKHMYATMSTIILPLLLKDKIVYIYIYTLIVLYL